MPEDVLVALDGSTRWRDLLEYAFEEFPGSAVTALYVVDPVESNHAGAAPPLLGYWGEWYREAVRAAEARLDEAVELGHERGVEVTPVRTRGRAARELVRYVTENGVDHVVVGPHGHGRLARAILGDVAMTVVRRSPVPVTVVR